MPRLTMLSMPCDEPVPVLEALLRAGTAGIASVVLASAGRVRQSLAGGAEDSGAIGRIAREAGVPVVVAGSMREVREAIARDAPDLAVAACFPWRLRRETLDLPRQGIINIHPSLLPAGRGPEPVFWTFRNGERETGVTVHRMDEGLDTGPILARRRVAVPDDLSAPALEARLLGIGADLLVEMLEDLAAGRLPGTPQDHAAATAAPSPVAADWLMPSSLPAGWAWRFARAVAPMGGPLAAAAGGSIIPVGAPLAVDDWNRLAAAVIDHGDGTVTIRFSPGWVRFPRAAAP